MKVVEALSENYSVALLNSKNAWRILGQESYSYEIAQDLEYDVSRTVVVLPIGNAGNITAVMSGFMKFFETGIIDTLPKIVGVQSEHANPVYRYYLEPDEDRRQFVPITVRSSVAQAAMIGNPVSMPRVIHLAKRYNELAGDRKTFFVEVSEQDIMDWEILANRNGHIACTHGGESLAGLLAAKNRGIIDDQDIAVLDSTAHAIKFAGFQAMYFDQEFPPDYKISPKQELVNTPVYIHPENLATVPAPGRPLNGQDLKRFVTRVAQEIADLLELEKI
jgi:threonine synthase